MGEKGQCRFAVAVEVAEHLKAEVEGNDRVRHILRWELSAFVAG